MEKLIKAFLILLFMCVTLWSAPNYMQQLEQYDVQMKNATHDETLRIFHGLKAIYIQSIIGNDLNLKKETLERLVKTAQVLKLDTSKYESELATMGGKDVKKSAPSKPLIPPPAAEESFHASSSSTPSMPSSMNADKSMSETNRVSSQKTANTSLPKTYNGKNTLQHVSTNDDEVVLDFGSAVIESNVKIFVLKNAESYKKIIDIPAVIVNAPLSISTPKKLQGLRVSQYNSETIRVIVDAPLSFETYVSVLENSVIISLNKKPVLTKRTYPSSTVTTPTPTVTQEAPKKNLPAVAPSSEQASSFTPSPVSNAKNSNSQAAASIPAPIMASNVASSPSKKGAKKDKTIVIDAGHGGKDAGAIGYKQRMEKDLVLDMALQLGKELKTRGYKIYFTRQKDEFINLRDRTKVANDKNADLFLSLHANAAPNEAKKLSMKGLETFFLSPDRSERSKNVAALENQSDMEEMDFYSKETFLNVLNREKIILSNKVAIDVQSSMLKSVKKRYSVEDGGVREAPFWVLVGATMPSVLIELGYISNPEESDNMFNPQYQKLLVDGISDGIDRYYTNNP